jgi:hypothetical protein
MGFEVTWSDFSTNERDMFQKVCRKLLKQTFIVREKEEEKKLYYFVSKNSNVFSMYFNFIGFDVVIDRDSGVAMLSNCNAAGEYGKIQSNRLKLKLADSIVLCCLWTLYADRINAGSLSKTIVISMTDLLFELEKYGYRDKIDKTYMERILKMFSEYSLLEVNGKIGEGECFIRLYSSLQFALDTEEFKVFVENVVAKMHEKNLSVTEGEDTDDSEE